MKPDWLFGLRDGLTQAPVFNHRMRTQMARWVAEHRVAARGK